MSSQQPGERNFHVFYMILTSATKEQRRRWGLGDVDSAAWAFQYARESEFNLPGRNEGQEYLEMMEAFAALKFEPAQVERIFAAVSAIMHLGNIGFEDAAAENASKEHDSNAAGPAAVLVQSTPSHSLETPSMQLHRQSRHPLPILLPAAPTLVVACRHHRQSC